MTLLGRRPSTGLLAIDLENYVAHEREVSVWGFPHFVRYLRAIIYKLTPLPHRCTEIVLDAAAPVLASGQPDTLHRFMTTSPNNTSPAKVSREAANAICGVIGAWAGYSPDGVSRLRTDDDKYQCARDYVRQIENAALNVGLTRNDLCECAVDANSDAPVETNRRDAAVAAMTAGHFRLAHEIVTDAPRDPN